VGYVNKERGLIFLAHPRTASQSIGGYLESVGFELDGNNHHLGRRGHSGVAFAVVRNPYDVLVSWWFNRNWPIPFGVEFFERLKTLAVYFEPLWFHLPDTDHIIHFENLEGGLSSFLGEKVSLEKKNVSKKRKGRHWREFYTEEMKAYVDEWLSHEINYFGYGGDHATTWDEASI